MKHSKVVVDTYAAVGNNRLFVEGRYNHASSTEVDIERSFQVKLERLLDVDQEIEDGFELLSSPLYTHNQNSTDVNWEGDDPKIETHINAINRTLDSMLYKPDGCNNAYECFPKEQSMLLPYLVDKTVRDNNNFYNPTSKTLTIPKNETKIIWYDPSFFGDIFISTFGATAQAQNVPEGNFIQGNAHVFTADGLHPRNLVRFDGEVDNLIPVHWGDDDVLLCAPGRVHIHDSVFGLAVDEFRTFDLQDALFSLPFSDLGLARQSDADVYARAAATHEEMMSVDITAGIIPPIAVTAQTGENAKIVMWLRRPSYARGSIINRDVHPGIRLLLPYFGHQDIVVPVGGGNAAPGAIVTTPTRFDTFPRYLSKRKGTNVPAPVSKNVPLGSWAVEFSYRKSAAARFLDDTRTISEYRLTIDDNALYQYLRDNGNATTTRALILEANRFPRLPIPDLTEQHAGTLPTEVAVPLVIFFQKRHAHTYDDGTQQVRFERATLAAQGGANNWGYGSPLICPLSEITGLRDDAGALIQNAGGNAISVGLLSPLAVKSGLVNALRGTYDFTTAATVERNQSLTHGTKVLFEHNQANEEWSHFIRFRPWVKVQKQETTRPNEIPEVSVEYIVYPNNNQAQVDAGNQVSTIEYHLFDSDVLNDHHREVYTGLDDATKSLHWDGYISQHRIQWLKLQRQSTTDPNTQIVTNQYFLYTDGNQQPHADNQNQQSQVVWAKLRYNTSFANTFDTISEATRRIWYAEYYQANALEHDERLAAEKEAQDRDDLFYQHLSSQMRGSVSTLAPHFYEEVGIPVAQPTVLKNVGTVTLREKLFGYKTLSCLQPSKIFPQFGEFYPLSLQDYELTFRVNSDPQRLFKHSQTKVAQIAPQISFSNIVSSEPTRIYVRSRDSENQQEKELLKCSYFYPEFERFQSVTTHVGESIDDPVAKVVVRCVTGSRLPDYMFIYSERITENLGLYEHECPKIEEIRISRNEQATRIYNSGVLTKYDLFDCTRRNSHPRADLQQLYKEFGGVLLSKFDLGTLLSEELATYRLELQFEITLEREPSNEDTTSAVDQTLVEILDDEFQNTVVSDAFPDEAPPASVRYDTRIELPTKTTVLFIYEDGSHLVGEPRKLIFKKTAV